LALLALEAVQTSGVLVTVASTAIGVTAVTLADMPSAQAGTITMTGGSPYFGSSPSNKSVSTGTLTIFDLVGGGATTTSLTFTAKNNASSTRSITSSAFSTVAAGSSGTLSGGSINKILLKNQTSSATVGYTYNAASTTSVSAVRTYSFASGSNRSATLTVVGSGVAPVAGMTQTGSTYVLVNGPTSGIQVTITNSGTGNKAAAIVSGGATLNNLNGSIGSVSGFSGGGASVALGDAYGGPSSTQTFTFTPTGLTTKGQTVAGSAVATFSNGIGASNAKGSLTATLTGTGVAPVNAVASSGSLMARIGTSATATVAVTNIGDGNLSGLGTVSNLNGTIGTSLGAGFTAKGGNPSTISLTDAASTTLGFTFSPVSKGTSSVATTFSFSNGDDAGTNKAQTVTAAISAQGVGPEFQSTFKSTVNTPTAVPGGATASSGPTISFGSVGYGVSTTTYLQLANITSDPNGGDASLTDLTLKSFVFGGPDASSFSVGLGSGTVISKGGSVWLPITVLGTSLGMLSSTLTIFTDQSVALGGVGDTFTYNLTALVPEPTSLAVLGGGLMGLALFRARKQRRRTEAAA
jgi:hypothetical protein